MLELLKFVFSSFWVWAGTVILVSVAVSPLFGLLARAVERPQSE